VSAAIRAGTAVVLQLGSPREQVFGIVLQLDTSGVLLRGISLSSVEDWLRQVPRPDDEAQASWAGSDMGLSKTFCPMHRVEKVLFDEPHHGMPAIHERFEERSGRALEEFVRAVHRDLGET